jgi:dethiobiotin synthetase
MKLKKKAYFVTGIDTDSGKSVASAILVKALGADYWKPIQAGFPTDTEFVKELVADDSIKFHKESYLLEHPMSPHAAADLEGIQVKLNKITIPQTDNTLIVEGAGGILVPLNQEDYVIDIADKFDLEVILVSRLYLGNINHTLLSVSELKRRGLKLKGIIFNGKVNEASQEIILKKAGVPCLFHILEEEKINPEIIVKYAKEVKV